MLTLGQIVKLSHPAPDEAKARFVLVELNGDRCFIRLICSLPIAPTELVRTADIQPAE